MRVSRLAFGQDSHETDRRARLSLVDGVAAVVPRTGHDKNAEGAAAANRGIVSHMHAQAAGLACFLESSELHKVQHTFSYNISDDASMWVRSPTLHMGDPLIPDSLRRAALRGKNVQLPVVNAVECLFVRKLDTFHAQGEAVTVSNLRSATVHSPAQPMPCSNTATVRHHWKRWSAHLCTMGMLRMEALLHRPA